MLFPHPLTSPFFLPLYISQHVARRWTEMFQTSLKSWMFSESVFWLFHIIHEKEGD